MHRTSFVLFFFLFAFICSGQYNWKLEKDKEGIKVFTSDVAHSPFKAIKVECTLKGSYTKLLTILGRVSDFSDWIYNTKLTKMVKQINANDFTYYSETHLPWPMANRDVVIRVRVKTDSLPNFLTIAGNDESNEVIEIPGKVRVKHYKSYWKVTAPAPGSIRIFYILELDPGGSIPAWIANMFADKGPYGTFANLAEQLKK
ncbi:MAG: START domain-containing protein [Chitinophagaceae bacterium]